MEYNTDYINGYIERKPNGTYQGMLSIDGIDISPIIGVYFQKDDDKSLWLKRKRILEYNDTTQTYNEREAYPKWEAYLKKQTDANVVAYKGEFFFLRFRFTIIGVWDKVLGKDSKRINFIVERCKMSEQTIINKINARKLGKQ